MSVFVSVSIERRSSQTLFKGQPNSRPRLALEGCQKHHFPHSRCVMTIKGKIQAMDKLIIILLCFVALQQTEVAESAKISNISAEDNFIAEASLGHNIDAVAHVPKNETNQFDTRLIEAMEPTLNAAPGRERRNACKKKSRRRPKPKSTKRPTQKPKRLRDRVRDAAKRLRDGLRRLPPIFRRG
ncbi:hypothetical protein FHG87_000006 [Trinorchestia longiramus]|nr:hypothetical protein FHG87_000006 [Trinorchestia longiramus]